MSLPTPPSGNDYGIIFYATTEDPPPTYVDIWGQARTAILLQDGVEVFMPNDPGTPDPAFIESAFPHAGAAARFTFEADVVLDTGTIDTGLNGHRDLDPTQPWARLVTFRNDNQKSLAVHNFTTTGRYDLQTANVGAVPEIAWSATFNTGGAADAQWIIVRMWVER